MANPLNFIYGLLGQVKDVSSQAIGGAVNGAISGAVNGYKFASNTAFQAFDTTRKWTANTAHQTNEAFRSTRDKCHFILYEFVADGTLRVLQYKPVKWTVQKAFDAYDTGLLRTPPQELLELNQQLTVFSNNPENASLEDVEKLNQSIDFFAHHDFPQLKAPVFLPEEVAAFNSLCGTIKGIITNRNHVAAGVITEEMKEELLEPLAQEEFKKQLAIFSPAFQKNTIDKNYGYANAAGNHVIANKGKWFAVVTLAGTLYLTGSPALALSTSGFAGPAAANLPLAKALVTEPSKVFAGTYQKVKVVIFGNPLLSDTRSKVQELEAAIEINETTAIAKSAGALKSLLVELDKEQNTVFNPPLNRKELLNFQNLREGLEQLDEHNPSKEFKKSVENAIVVLDKKHRNQRGLIESLVAPVNGVVGNAGTNAKKIIGQGNATAKELIQSAGNTATGVIAEPLADAKTFAQLANARVEDLEQKTKTFVQLANDRVEGLEHKVTTFVQLADERVEGVVENVQHTVFNALPANLYNTFGNAFGMLEAPKPRAARTSNASHAAQQQPAPAAGQAQNAPQAGPNAPQPAAGQAPNAPQPGNQPQQAAPAPAAAPVNPPPAGGAQEGTVSQFLEWAATHLTSLIGDQYAGKLADKAVPAAVGFIALIINQFLPTLDSSPASELVKAKLNEIVAALNGAVASKEWKKLPALLQNAAHALKGVKIYFGKFRFPVPGTGANLDAGKTTDAAFADNMAALNRAVEPAPKPKDVDWKQLALDEKDKLVSNATSFLTMKHIYEQVCGLQPTSEKFYRDLLADAQIETSANGKTKKALDEEKLKTLFFERLNERRVGVFKKLYAEFQYWIYAKGVKFFTKKATTIYFQEIFKFIGNHEKDKFNIVRNMLINNLTRYLTILGGAYKTVANTPSATGLMSEMLMKELEKPEANLGFETKDLYTDFAKIVLKKTGGSVFGWIASRLLGNPEEIIRSVIDTSTGSLHDTNGYAHAINTVIGEQLDVIWELLQPSPSDQPATTTSGQGTHAVSEGQKNQLSILVKNLFEILQKSKCSTVDELRNLMEGKLLKENVNQAIDGLFIPDIIEQIAVILASTVESLVQTKQLEKLTYTFASLINNTFENGKEISQTDMQNAEKKVTKLSEQILGFAVNSAIKDQLNFSGKKLQEEAKGFVDQLHAISNAYFNDTTTPEGKVIHGATTQLQRIKELHAASQNPKQKIDELFKTTEDYHKECQSLNQQVNASKINIDNKEEVNKRIMELTQQSKTLLDDIAQLKIHSDGLGKLQNAIPHLSKIREITYEIGRRFYKTAYASKEDIEFAESQMILMATLITELQKVGNVKDIITLFKAQQERLERIITDQGHALAVRSLYAELTKPNSLLEQIIAEKKRGQVSTENLKEMTKKLLTQVSSDSVRADLFKQLKAIQEGSLDSQIDTAQTAFMGLLNQAVSEANSKILPGRNEHHFCCEKIDGIINGTHFLEPQKVEEAKEAIRGAMTSAEQHLTELKAWESEHYKQIVHSNFSLSPIKWLQDWGSENLSGFVHGRVRERLDGVLNLLKREETYRYGILHHAVLIPYVQRTQKQKK